MIEIFFFIKVEYCGEYNLNHIHHQINIQVKVNYLIIK